MPAKALAKSALGSKSISSFFSAATPTAKTPPAGPPAPAAGELSSDEDRTPEQPAAPVKPPHRSPPHKRAAPAPLVDPSGGVCTLDDAAADVLLVWRFLKDLGPAFGLHARGALESVGALDAELRAGADSLRLRGVGSALLRALLSEPDAASQPALPPLAHLDELTYAQLLVQTVEAVAADAEAPQPAHYHEHLRALAADAHVLHACELMRESEPWQLPPPVLAKLLAALCDAALCTPTARERLRSTLDSIEAARTALVRAKQQQHAAGKASGGGKGAAFGKEVRAERGARVRRAACPLQPAP